MVRMPNAKTVRSVAIEELDTLSAPAGRRCNIELLRNVEASPDLNRGLGAPQSLEIRWFARPFKFPVVVFRCCSLFAAHRLPSGNQQPIGPHKRRSIDEPKSVTRPLATCRE
jgi:hypothetical protein